MRLYEETIEQFRQDVDYNRLTDILTQKFSEAYHRKAGFPEINSWNNSLRFLRTATDFASLKDNMVVLEFKLPLNSDRIDAMLFGMDEENNENVVLIELKQWSNPKVHPCEIEGNVLVEHGKNWVQHEHPSMQAEGYYNGLMDSVAVFEEKPVLGLESWVYCHNYSRINDGVLYDKKYDGWLKKYHLFSKDDVGELGKYLNKKLKAGHGLEVLGRFNASPIRPSKKLMEHVHHMVNENQMFNLMNEQIAAYNAIIDRAKKVSTTKKKSVIIVNGGPGTGKSVIALQVMSELMKKGKEVYHATGSSSFTKTLRKILGGRLSNRFHFFFNFTHYPENSVDVLICDEAHRIRKDSNDWGVPYKLKSKNPQVEDIIKSAKLTVFFIDEFQVVRPNEVGSIDLIKKAALKYTTLENIYEFELKTQFRCSGSDAFLQWIDNMLDVRPSDHVFLTDEDKMEFKIVDNPAELKRLVDEKNAKKSNSARIVAGFCWPWSDPRADGTLVDDVVIGDFRVPWEAKHGKRVAPGIPDASLWAYDPGGVNQVGTVYTIQGFEFDYVGVIFGKDLVYNPGTKVWECKPENSHDSMIKRNNADITKHLKNVYRVLLSRAHKGVFVYFMDENTRKFFESRVIK